MRPPNRLILSATIAAAALVAVPARAAHAAPAVHPGPTPRATCGPGSNPETGMQGRVSTADVDSGRAAKGYTCNTEILSRYGTTGGFRVHRYVDPAGHECAYMDTTQVFPLWNLRNYSTPTPDKSSGVFVLDMSDPARPVHTATLLTPAMLTPHESLSINTKRGLLAADMGSPYAHPGFVDIYDIAQDCRHPVLRSSLPLAILGHEGAFAPDGNTFYVSSTGGHTITALDVTDPGLPRILWTTLDFVAHGMNVSDDGNRLYIADIGSYDERSGFTILDVSEIQRRAPNPTHRVVSHLSWPEVSIPQTAIPVTIGGHPYVVEVDEFTRRLSQEPGAPVGAARIIDIADETKPRVVSNLRLEVNMPSARAGESANDPQANVTGGYTAHYCAVPTREEPGIVGCSFILSGMRIFDIRDPLRPRELAYANFPNTPSAPGLTKPTSFTMSAPAFVPERGEFWFADANSGFYAVRLTNGVWPFTAATAATPPAATPAPAIVQRAVLPATGPARPGALGTAAAFFALLVLGVRRRAGPGSAGGRSSRRG